MRGEKRTDRGTEPPTSSTFRGRPRPTCTNSPSSRTRFANLFWRVATLEKSTSGISRSDLADGSRRDFLVDAFFIAPSFVTGRASRTDESCAVVADLDEHHEKSPAGERQPDDERTLGMPNVVEDQRERIREDGDRFVERDVVLAYVTRSLPWIPNEQHQASVIHL
jgi:hypothetical protein